MEIAPESAAITLKGSFTAKQAEALENVFQTPAGKESVHRAVDRLKAPPLARPKAPSERGERFRIPLLTMRQGELWERRSNGKGLFIMPREKDWAAIQTKLLGNTR